MEDSCNRSRPHKTYIFIAREMDSSMTVFSFVVVVVVVTFTEVNVSTFGTNKSSLSCNRDSYATVVLCFVFIEFNVNRNHIRLIQ